MGWNPRPSNRRPKPPSPPPRKIVPPSKDFKPCHEWGCEYCNTANDADDKRCAECGAPRPKIRVEYIDVGNMSPEEAEETLRRVRRDL